MDCLVQMQLFVCLPTIDLHKGSLKLPLCTSFHRFPKLLRASCWLVAQFQYRGNLVVWVLPRQAWEGSGALIHRLHPIGLKASSQTIRLLNVRQRAYGPSSNLFPILVPVIPKSQSICNVRLLASSQSQQNLKAAVIVHVRYCTISCWNACRVFFTLASSSIQPSSIAVPPPADNVLF